MGASGFQAKRPGDPNHDGGNPRFVKDFNQYGAMSAHFVPHNLKYYFANLHFPRLQDGRLWYDPEGNSVSS